jgi:hypothetical protein
MSRHKTGIVKKGYVMLYVLIMCALCIMIVSYSFYFEIKKRSNIESYERYVVKNNKYSEYKEKAFTFIHKDIIENVQALSYSTIRLYLSSRNPKFFIDNKSAVIRYDSSTNRILFETPYTEDYYRRDTYDYKVVSGKLKYVFLKSLYIKGRIQ